MIKNFKDRWNNKYLEHLNIHYSRIIISWIRAGGSLKNDSDIEDFKQWLKETTVLTDEQMDDIVFLATNGKMEWEDSAKIWLKTNKK